MYNLVFSRDSILRVKMGVYSRSEKKHYPILLPLEEVEMRGKNSFLSCLTSGVEFESGLTVGECLRALAPWDKSVSRISSCNLSAHLDELEFPTPSLKEGDAPLAILGFTYGTSVEAEPEFEDMDIEERFVRISGSRMSEWISPRPKITNSLNLNGGQWDCSGYLKDTVDFFDNNENRYGLSVSPLREWGHLEIKVVDHFWLWDTTINSDYLTDKSGLFNSENSHVQDVFTSDGRLYARKIRVRAPQPTLMDTILKCLVWELGFHGNPEDIRKFSEDLHERVEEVEVDKNLRNSAKSVDALYELEAAIEVEIEEEEERERICNAARPFDSEDLALLALTKKMMLANPSSIKAPDGIPTPPFPRAIL
jgi:hypothetical protein